MKHLLQIPALIAFALFFLIGAAGSHCLVAQGDADKHDKRTRAEIELAEELELERRQLKDLEAQMKAHQKQAELQELDKLKAANAKTKKNKSAGVTGKSSITINGKTIKIDGKDIESFLQSHGKELESWAENHAGEWEKWAEKFESKMEKMAKHQEVHWEKWAEQYSKRWEDWAEKIESGEIKGDEIGDLVEDNLKMLSDMPLGSLIDGALQEGLGELKNAPWESLGELHELVGGSLEQALREMEKEVASSAKSELHKAMGGKSQDFRATIRKLQDAIEAKGKKIDDDSEVQLSELKKLLGARAKQGEVSEKALMDVQKALKDKESAHKSAKDKAYSAQVEAYKKALEHLEHSKRAAVEADLTKLKNAEALAKAARDRARAEENSAAKTLESYLSKARKESQKLKTKESEIDAMRREIEELRREVDRLKKDR